MTDEWEQIFNWVKRDGIIRTSFVDNASLLKESVDLFDEDLREENMNGSLLTLVDDELNALSSDLESCMVNEEGVEVSAVIAGYISKAIFDKNECEVCKTLLTTVKSDSSKFNYLNKLSRWGLMTSSIDLLHYVSKSLLLF